MGPGGELRGADRELLAPHPVAPDPGLGALGSSKDEEREGTADRRKPQVSELLDLGFLLPIDCLRVSDLGQLQVTAVRFQGTMVYGRAPPAFPIIFHPLVFGPSGTRDQPSGPLRFHAGSCLWSLSVRL